jgi:hypothetical protein
MSWAEILVTNAPCLVSFKWKTSSESGYDWLTFYVDGEQKDRISGVMDAWADYSLAIADSGPHTLRWTYSKDGSALSGEDCGWVKDFAIIPVETRSLTLNANGGWVSGGAAVGMSVVEGCAIGKLPVPAWNGEGARRFVSWFTAATGGDEVTAATIVTEELTTIYAHWRDINPPSNDNFADAIEIQGTSGTINGTNIDATTEDYFCAEEGDVWWKWTATASGKTSFEVRSSQNMGFCISIATGDSLDSLDELVCIDDDDYEGFCHAEVDAEEGTTYYILIGGSGATCGEDNLGLSRLGDFILEWFMAPDNDEYDNAQMLDSTNSGSVTGTLLGATITETDCIWRYGDAERTVWYKWVAPFTGAVLFNATAANGRSDLLYLVATHGYDEDDEEWDDCGYDEGSVVHFNVEEGETYYVSIATWNYIVNGFTLSWQRLVPPANDDFAGAATVSGASGSVTGTTLGATIDDGGPYAYGGDDIPEVWWKWTAPADCTIVFDTHGSDYDTSIAVYSGNSLDSLECVTENDDYYDDNTSRVEFDAEADTTYYIAIGGYAVGNVTLAWQKPTLAADVVVEVNGAAVSFETAADGNTRTATVAAGTTAEDISVFVGGVDVTRGFKVAVEGTTATVVLREPYETAAATSADLPWTDNGDGSVTMNVEVVPGLYYAADSAATIDALKRPSAAEPAKAGDAVVAPKQDGAQGFYQVWVSDSPIKAE